MTPGTPGAARRRALRSLCASVLAPWIGRWLPSARAVTRPDAGADAASEAFRSAREPRWPEVPDLEFRQGEPARFDLRELLPGSERDRVAFALNDGNALPPGVTLNGPFIEYDGISAAVSADGIRLVALDATTEICSFELTSVVGGEDLPFTVGQAFRQGDVPAGSAVSGRLPALQIVPMNRWSDGSLKFAIISGRATLAPGRPGKIALHLGHAAARPAMTEADLRASRVSAAIDCGAYGSLELGPLIGKPWKSWISGPEMSSWIYRGAIGADRHLTGWFEVRLYRGGDVEILPWVENGYLKVAGPETKSARARFRMNEATRYDSGGDLRIMHHTRVVLASGSTFTHWSRGDPQITARHDGVYLSATRLVPNYGWRQASGTAGRTVPAAWSPNYHGWERDDTSMGSSGYQPHLGLLPLWAALYVTRGSADDWRRCVVHGYYLGSYSIHFRNEATLRPVRFSDHPTDTLQNTSVPSVPNRIGDTINASYAVSHAPSACFLPYLMTGWHWFLEEHCFQITYHFLYRNFGPGDRDRSMGIMRSDSSDGERFAGWSLRNLAQGICALPDGDDWLRPEFIASFERNIEHYHACCIAGTREGGALVNDLGVIPPALWKTQATLYPAGRGRGVYYGASWMQAFFIQSLGYASDLDLPLAPAARKAMITFRDWCYQSTVHMAGYEGQWCYRQFGPYEVPYGPSKTGTGASRDAGAMTGWFRSWHEVWAEYSDRYPDFATLSCARNQSIKYHSDARREYGQNEFRQGYTANHLPALAYAVEHGATGAREAWQLITNTPTWRAFAPGFSDLPQWGIVPRMEK